jgi:hypothetical protein
MINAEKRGLDKKTTITIRGGCDATASAQTTQNAVALCAFVKVREQMTTEKRRGKQPVWERKHLV